MLAPMKERDSWRRMPAAWPVPRSMRAVMSALDAGRRHAVVERQHLDGRALYTGRMSAGMLVTATIPPRMMVSINTVMAGGYEARSESNHSWRPRG